MSNVIPEKSINFSVYLNGRDLLGVAEGTPLRPYNAMIDGGVEFDLDGKPVAYHIANRHPLSELSGQQRLEYVRVPAFGAQRWWDELRYTCFQHY